MNIIDRQRNAIAQGCLTNSKNPKSLMYGLYPTHIKAAHGAHLWDMDDKRWLDFMCGLGCNFLGYGNDKVSKAIVKHAFNGASHSVSTIYEVEAAESIKSIFPFIDLIKFTKTGTLACEAAVRIARAYTGRTKILSDGYHGHGDDFVSMTPPAHGVPVRDWMGKLEDDLSNIDRDTAAVIIEPVITEHGLERSKWLKQLRVKCDEVGAVLIFDEVITGFRFKKFGVSNCYGVTPDLICLGKAMANGMPLACVGGKRDLMNCNYFISSTYAGDILSLVACKSVIDQITRNSDYSVDHLWYLGEKWLSAFNANEAGLRIDGYPTRGVFVGEPEKIAMFFQEMGKALVIFCKSWFFNWHLAEQTDSIMPIVDEIMFRIKEGKVKLEYPLPEAPYAQKIRERNNG